MLPNLDRTTIVHFLVGLALVVGGWIFFVQPRLDELGQLETTITERRARASIFGVAAREHITQQTSLLRAQVAQVNNRNAIAADSAALYARITSLANQHDVKVQNLQGAPAPATSQAAGIDVSRVDLTVQGGYEQIANFIEALDEFDGHLRPSTLQVTPAQVGTQPTVSMRLRCDALSFTLPSELTQLQGAEHGNP